jgi:hypothetical protein
MTFFLLISWIALLAASYKGAEIILKKQGRFQ